MEQDVYHGNEGCAEEAEALTRQYESVRFVDVHGPVLHLLPTVPSDVLDIGAGTGRDAGALAAMGHRVVAVEPTAEFRDRAARLHPSPRIEWVSDYLPDLVELTRRGDRFDVVMLHGCLGASRLRATSRSNAEGHYPAQARGPPATESSSWPHSARSASFLRNLSRRDHRPGRVPRLGSCREGGTAGRLLRSARGDVDLTRIS
jgi:SAM-dependent methyltransferase